MKILSIGLDGIPSATRSDLISANVFQDYEAIVVKPSDLHTLYGEYTGYIFSNRDLDIITDKFASFAANLNFQRRQQVKGLIENNGAVICFLQPYLSWRTADKTGWISNYSWLFDIGDIGAQLGNIVYGTGTTFDYINPSHYFTEYLSTRPNWTAHIPADSCDKTKWKIIASAFRTHLLSVAGTTETGRIIFLPSEYDTQNGELLEQCIRKLLGDKDITPTPEWAIAISVPGQDKIRKQLGEIDAQFDAINQERSSLVSQNTALESWKWLLYETGKHRLEPIVHKALSLLGCKVQPQPDSDSDGRVETEFGIALLEIEGTKETVKVEKISQLLKNIANLLAQEGVTAKGILVGNPFRLEDLPNRPPNNSQKKLFSDEVLRTAEMHNISVLLTANLYEIVSLILDTSLTTQQSKSLRGRIFQGKGLVTLSVP
jgi:hypothetical protein